MEQSHIPLAVLLFFKKDVKNSSITFVKKIGPKNWSKKLVKKIKKMVQNIGQINWSNKLVKKLKNP